MFSAAVVVNWNNCHYDCPVQVLSFSCQVFLKIHINTWMYTFMSVCCFSLLFRAYKRKNIYYYTRLCKFCLSFLILFFLGHIYTYMHKRKVIEKKTFFFAWNCVINIFKNSFLSESLKYWINRSVIISALQCNFLNE